MPAATGSPAPASPSLSTPSAAPTSLSIVAAAIDALGRKTSYRLFLETRRGRTIDRYEILTVSRPRAGWSASRESTSETVRAIVIGNRAWIDRGTGTFVPAGITEAKGLVGVDAVDGILATYGDPGLASALRFVGREEHLGAPADHYRATTAALHLVRPSASAAATLDVWIAPGGHLVGISSVGLPGSDDEVRVEISNVDDPANAVEPPG